MRMSVSSPLRNPRATKWPDGCRQSDIRPAINRNSGFSSRQSSSLFAASLFAPAAIPSFYSATSSPGAVALTAYAEAQRSATDSRLVTMITQRSSRLTKRSSVANT